MAVRTFWIWIAALALLQQCAACMAAQHAQPKSDAPEAEKKAAPQRIFEQEPYDLIHLKDGKEIKVQLLPLKNRRLPDKPRASDKLTVHTLDDPDTEYEVAWGEIDLEKTRLFEQLILDEAEQLVTSGRFNDAYDYYDYLQHFYPKLPGLDDSVQRYLFEEAKHYQRLEQFDQALALLNEVHRRNPQRAELPQAIGLATGKLVEQTLARNDYASARKLVRSLQAKFPTSPVAATWVEQLSVKARENLAQAQADFARGKYREAADAARLSMHVWPLDEARRLLTEAHQKFPRVVVGVTLPAGDREADPMVDWAARRSARLFNRRLLEFTGYGPQGGVYQCPVGDLERQDLGKRLVVRLRPDIPWSDGKGVLTGIDVGRRLLQMADSRQPTFSADWAELFRSVSVHSVYDVDIELRRAHVHPDGMLRTILTPWDSSETGRRDASIGPYVVDSSSSGDNVHYLANKLYFASNDTQPREVVERYYADQRKALQALKNGEIAMLDRVVPWEIEALAASGDVVVERYAVPTIHCLIPNLDQPLLARRAFRRALAYGINRPELLRAQMLRGASPTLGQVVSGPFPRGETLDDPVGYAYNDNIEPYSYNPSQSLVLVSLARQELALREVKKEEPSSAPAAGPAKGEQEAAVAAEDLAPLPKLVLAHPPHDLARVACRAIQKQLEVVHVPIELKELKTDSLSGAGEHWDLLYAELNMWEPVIDARRLLGPKGLTGNCSSYMDLALRQLEQAEDWKHVREKLLEVHRQAHEDVAIIPLWQLVDHFAYHKSLEGVGKRPVTLYQHIEAWRAPPWFSVDAL